MPILQRAIELWYHDPACTTPVLKLMAELVHNRYEPPASEGWQGFVSVCCFSLCVGVGAQLHFLYFGLFMLQRLPRGQGGNWHSFSSEENLTVQISVVS